MILKSPRGLLACVALAFSISLVRAADEAPPKPVPDAQWGNVLYKTPDAARWTASDRGDRRVYSAAVPAPDFCTLTVFTGEKNTADFAASFERAVTASLRESHSEKIERDTGPQPGKSREGFDVLQRTLVAEAPGFHTYHWFIAGNSGGRFDLMAFQTSSEEMFRQYGQEAANFFYSVKLANSLGATTPAATANPPGAATTPATARNTTGTAATGKNVRFGPIAVGDHVEIPWAGGWVAGTVLHVEGLTYFVHYAIEKLDDGAYDDFFTLNLIRPAGGGKTFSETFHDTMPDPEGGPLAIGARVEFYGFSGWKPGRVARRLGERYVVFEDKPGDVTEVWVTADKIRLPGSTTTLAPERPFKQRQPTSTSDIRNDDLVEAKPRKGSWAPLTVLARKGDSYFVKIAPNSGQSMRSWVDLSHMRPVGAKNPFQAEDLAFFVGRWRLTGDSFQNLIDRKVSGGTVTETYQNNSGAGKDAGGITINADGTYQLSNTVVYHDGKGRWERNPNQDEGGILLKGADDKGAKDCLVTNHQDGYAYLQGSIRGPGKWCTRVGN